MCEWKPDFDALNSRVDGIESRLTQVEHDVGKMRSETQEGFKQAADDMREIRESVKNLAHDFGERMNGIDKRLITEKEKWGDCLRKILLWTAATVLSGCAVAMGVTIYKNLFPISS